MKLLIAGSRGIGNYNFAPYIPDGTDTIISGGAFGIDSAAERFADAHGLKKIIIRPEYQLYGRRAPLLRNETMVDMADAVLIVWDGVSRGTKYTLDYAKRQNKPILLITVSE